MEEPPDFQLVGLDVFFAINAKGVLTIITFDIELIDLY